MTTHGSRFFQLLLLTAATFAATYGRFTLGPLQETLRADLMLSDNQIALLQGPAMAIPMAVGSIPIGLIVDRYSRARLFAFFVGLALLATMLTAFASSLPVLLVVRCLAGLASAATLVTAFSMLADLYAPEQRGRATMVTLFGEIGGAPAAFAVGGVLLSLPALISVGGMENWRGALLWMCGPLVPALLLMLFLREPPRSGLSATRESQSVRSVWPRLWGCRAVVLPLLLARIMVWVADGAVLVWGAPSFARRFGLPPDQIGGIMAATLLAGGLLGPILGGPLADYCQRTGGPKRTMTAMVLVALVSAPAGLFSLMPDAMVAAFMLALFLILGFTVGTAALALATIVIPGELRGLYLAITVSVGAAFSIGVAPVVVSGLSGILGGPAMLGQSLALVCSVTSLLGAAVFLSGRRYFPGKTAT